MRFSPILSNSCAGRFANRGADAVDALLRARAVRDARMRLDSAPEMVGCRSTHSACVGASCKKDFWKTVSFAFFVDATTDFFTVDIYRLMLVDAR
jgi:hypothetical protein